MRMFKSDVVVKMLWFISEKRSETETASACLVNVMPWGNANKEMESTFQECEKHNSLQLIVFLVSWQLLD